MVFFVLNFCCPRSLSSAWFQIPAFGFLQEESRGSPKTDRGSWKASPQHMGHLMPSGALSRAPAVWLSHGVILCACEFCVGDLVERRISSLSKTQRVCGYYLLNNLHCLLKVQFVPRFSRSEVSNWAATWTNCWVSFSAIIFHPNFPQKNTRPLFSHQCSSSTEQALFTYI